jgi:hypothetical protein
MNTEIAYKGLKYIIIWIISYFVIKYIPGCNMSELDTILAATVVTLILSIIESMMLTKERFDSNQQMQFIENMGNLPQSNNMVIDPGIAVSHTIDRTPLNAVVNTTSVQRNTASNNLLSNDASSDLSLNSSSSLSSDISSGSSSTNQNTSISLVPAVPTVPTVPIMRKDAYTNAVTPIQQTANNRIDGTNYLGERSIFDANAFGGTNNQSITPNGSLDSLTPQPQIQLDTTNLVKPLIPVNNLTLGVDKIASSQVNGMDGYVTDVRHKMNNISIDIPEFKTKDVNLGNDIPGTLVRPDNALVRDPSNLDNMYDNPNVGQRLSLSGKPLKWYEQSFNPRSYTGAENLDQIAVSGGRTRNDLLVNDMIYSDFNRLPPSFNDKDFEYGYSFLPPKDWFPLPPYPPVCVSNEPSYPVQPMYMDTITMDLKEWHATQKITPPDSINTSFVTNELNSKV